MSKQFWIILGAIVVVLGGILILTNHPSSTGASGTPTHHVEGTSRESVTLVEYGDYECPVCGSFYATVKQVAAKYDTQIVFQFRNLPLVSIHQNAFAGARAAEAADKQGKFWQMHDTLYENQSSWAQASNPQTFFDAYARSLGLNAAQFDRDYASDAVNNAINADLNAFEATGDEMATPTFYLDGKKLDNSALVDPATGSPSLAAFSKVIDAELTAKAKA